MKKYLCILGITLLSLLTGCKEEERTAVSTQEKEKLTVWAWDESFNIKAVKEAAREYSKEHKEIDIKVTVKEKNEIMQKLRSEFDIEMYENLPDIVLIEDYEIQSLLADYAEEFLPMDSIIDYSRYQEYKTEITAKNGNHYGVPFDSGAAVLFYRKDYIEAAGYTDEDMQNLTWQKYMEIGQQVQEKLGISMLTVQPDDLGLIRIMIQSADSWYMDDSGTQAYIENNLALKESIAVYKELINRNLALPVECWGDFTDAFQDGKVATVVSGCWITSTIKEKQEQSGLWRVASIPKLEGIENAVNASNIGGSSWYVLKNKKNAKESANFLKETVGENTELLNNLVKEINLVSVRKDAGEFPEYEKTDEFFGNMNIFDVFLETTANVPVVNYGRYTYEIENILEKEMQKIIKRGNVEEYLREVQERAELSIY